MNSLLDTTLVILFVVLGLSIIMLFYMLINLVQSIKMLTKLIAGINQITLKATDMVTTANNSIARMKEAQGVVSLVLALGMIGISNHLYKKLRKIF